VLVITALSTSYSMEVQRLLDTTAAGRGSWCLAQDESPLTLRIHCAQALYGRLDRVFVPDMYEELSTQRCLVMEWVNGRRLRSGSDGKSPEEIHRHMNHSETCGLPCALSVCACAQQPGPITSKSSMLSWSELATAYCLSQEQDIAQQRCLLLAGGGFGTAGGEDDLALVEVGVRCSLEQVRTTLGVCICTGSNLELAQCICAVSQAPANSSVITSNRQLPPVFRFHDSPSLSRPFSHHLFSGPRCWRRGTTTATRTRATCCAPWTATSPTSCVPALGFLTPLIRFLRQMLFGHPHRFGPGTASTNELNWC